MILALLFGLFDEGSLYSKMPGTPCSMSIEGIPVQGYCVAEGGTTTFLNQQGEAVAIFGTVVVDGVVINFRYFIGQVVEE